MGESEDINENDNFLGSRLRYISGTLESVISDFIYSPRFDDPLLLSDDDEIVDVDGDGIDDTHEILSDEIIKGGFPEMKLTKKYCYEASAWMSKNSGVPDIVMSTIHGSFLYGTATTSSYPDFYLVSSQDISMNITTEGRTLMIVGMDEFKELLYSMDRRATEARYSPYCVFTNEKDRDKIMNVTVDMNSFSSILADEAEELMEPENLENSKHPFRDKMHSERIHYASKLAERDAYTPVWKGLEGDK